MSRHPATEHLIRLLDPNPNLPEPLLSVAQDCAMLRDDILTRLPNDGPEISAGLRKLLEAKDCFVRQALIDTEAVRAACRPATRKGVVQ